MIIKLLRDRRGAASYMFIIIFMIFIVLAGLVIDGGRFLIARAQLQTLVDASSLAGAMTGEVIVEKEVEPQMDNAGNIIEMKEVITGYHIEVDPIKAKEAALETAYLNGNPDFWKSQGGYFTLNQKPSNENPGWEGYQIGEDSYYTQARVYMKPGFFAPILESYSDNNYVPVYIDSKSKAFITELPSLNP